LVHANVHMDTEAVEEVIKLMQNLLQAWEQVVLNSGSGGANPAPSPSPSVVLTG